MGENSNIEWTDNTMNYWWGCTKVSPGCKHCYAATTANRYGFSVWGRYAPRRVFRPKTYNKPLNWNKKAIAMGKRIKVFCGSMMDWAEDYNPARIVPDGATSFTDEGGMVEGFELKGVDYTFTLDPYRDIMFNHIKRTNMLTWQLLTKRPERINYLVSKHLGLGETLPDNVWPMTSVEAQDQASRLSYLCNVPAKVRGASIEPLIGPLDISDYLGPDKINWIIIGGESGTGSRPMNPDWVESLISQGKEAGIAVFVKQFGTVYAKAHNTKHKKAGDISEWPTQFQIRQFPNSI